MERHTVSRRTLLRGGAALAGLAAFGFPRAALALPVRPGEEVLPWLDQPPENPVPQIIVRQLRWEAFDSWLTPAEQFFVIQHYGQPAIDAGAWRLTLDGLVERPLTLSLEDLHARPRQEVAFTLECSGNHGPPFFTGGVGNATWAGTPLAPLLAEAGVLAEGIEVVFWGTDAGPQEVGGAPVTEEFARSLSLADAADPNVLLCYEMNGAPLPPEHGAPVRLLAPGWYGVANVKWLRRIEVLDTRYQGRFMAREYVTRREEQRDGATVTRFTSVGRDLLKSAPARVTRLEGEYRITGAAWGAPIAGVEVRVDDGPWVAATLDEGVGAEFAWTLWSLQWGQLAPGEHTVTSRAIDTAGNIQPAPDDPLLATKRTTWESNGQITRRVLIPFAPAPIGWPPV